MGWRNPAVPWSELERRLSDRAPTAAGTYDPSDETPTGDGNDSPAWSRHRAGYQPPNVVRRRRPAVPSAELHCHSHFSFLDGACSPEALAEEAARLDLDALALTDHDGLYGVVRFAEAARALDLRAAFGAELTLGFETGARAGAEPESHLVVLARDARGYALLARAISEAQLRGSKGAPRCSLTDLATLGGTAAPQPDQGHWLVLTGCRKGAVPRALEANGPAAAADELTRLRAAFGAPNVAVELWDHGHPLDSARNDALAEVAVRARTELVATTNAHYATPASRPLATALAAVRARRSLDELDGWLPAGAGAHLRSGAEQLRRFARYPGVVERTAELGRACAFDLRLVAPALPPFPCPDGLDEMTYLRRLVTEGGTHRYGPRARAARAWAQIDHELAVIDELGFPGYFLVVADIVEFCRHNDIYCQGRGSAANSAVCYALGVTNVDAVGLGLLFERFLSPERDGPPDIDLDIESGRREEVIQYVYDRYGRHHAAQVANVITYRGRSAVRDMAKALGYAPGQADAWAKQLDRWSRLPDPTASPAPTERSGRATEHATLPTGRGGPPTERDDRATEERSIPPLVVDLARQLEHAPRHLGIHSGGMVICDRPVLEVCPVEWATMADRSVLQWDKDDCAAAGLVKFDLLGLGMLSALHYAVDFVAEAYGTTLDLAQIPQDDAVYDMLCEADSVGVFQVESRAQMATLPRLRPRCFYDLVVEVALIRPGPIQGGSVHPYIRRRHGEEPVTYLHPLLERSLGKTLGIPLFQEQLMQMAIDVAGFSPVEADELRRAMGAKRSSEKMDRLRQRFYEGMAERGITGEVGDRIWEKLAAFANFGFPESHSVSFAYLVYASSWLKLHYPAAFCAALLKAQPMGFYSPHSLVADARRHGVEVHTPDINASGADPTLAWPRAREPVPRAGEPVPQPDVRLGLASVRHLGEDAAQEVVAERERAGPFASMEDLRRRVPLSLPALEALATAGAFASLTDARGRSLGRRRALWAAGAVAQSSPDRLEGMVTGTEAPTLPGMSNQEMALADLWATGVAPGRHPTTFLREALAEAGVVTAVDLRKLSSGTKVRVGGVVTHRQRPATAGGTTFLNLEDETGFVNVVCSLGCWQHHRSVAASAPALLVRGRLESAHGVINVVAERLEPLPTGRDLGALRDLGTVTPP